MDKNATVLIMMTTYNGEKYVRKQIESIINQTYTNWKLIIQDDKSNDNTLRLIQNMALLDSRIIVFVNSGVHGAYYNFHSLINKCKNEKYDYYMFCDHDDIWYPNKIESFINFVSDKKDDIPLLVYADMDIIDENDNSNGKTIDGIFNIKSIQRWDSFYIHLIYGCNVFFNYSLFKIVPAINLNNKICSILCHDNLYVKYAEVYGEVIYLDKTLMGYRRYANNVTSEHNYDYGVKKVINSVKNIKRLLKAHARTYSQTLYTIKLMQNSIEETTYKKEIEEIRQSLQSGGIKAYRIMKKYNVQCGLKTRTISRKLILISGLYKRFLEYEEN